MLRAPFRPRNKNPKIMLTDVSRKRDFPGLSGMTYLNTAAESIPPLCVGQAIEEYVRDKSLGMRGREGHFAQVEACREVSARFLSLAPDEVSFCSCSSEAYNLLASALQLAEGDEVVVSDLDFPAGVTPWLRAANAPALKLWRAKEGVLGMDALEVLLNENTRLVQISLVSFYNGHRIVWKPFYDTVRSLAPRAVIAVDVTQALGRVVLDCAGADIVISSTHKWTLGIHGGCIIGIPQSSGERLTTRAGGWLHLENAFDGDRFEKAVSKKGAASFSVGMPNFISLYALNAALRYVEGIGVREIAASADPLVTYARDGLRERGVELMCPWNGSGILAFQHERSVELHAALERAQIHVMHNAGRIRVAIHGYNTHGDVRHLFEVLTPLLESLKGK